MTKTIALAAVCAAALAACAGAAAGPHGTHAKHARAVVKLRKTSLGKVLVDVRGRTLYLYTPDTGKKSTCYGGCASAWPPLLSTGKPKAGTGVKAKLLGLTMRTDGTHQVTYKGHPLYDYAADSKPGETSGEDVGGIWYVVSARGAKIEPRTGSSSTWSGTTSAASSSPSGWWRPGSTAACPSWW